MELEKIKVLLVDDSSVARQVLTRIISSENDLEVIGALPNGRFAVSKIETDKTDVVVLDIEMPEMDGLTALKNIRSRFPDMPVIMFSSLTQDGASATIEAMSLGARDYVCKPAEMHSSEAAIDHIRKELLPRIRNVAERCVPIRRARPTQITRRLTPIELVVISGTTASPRVMSECLSQMPPNLPVPLVCRLPFPPHFMKCFVDALTRQAALPIRIAALGDVLSPGKIWLLSMETHLVLQRSDTAFIFSSSTTASDSKGLSPADGLLHSAAKAAGSAVLGVILSGIGNDGVKGCQSVLTAGGSIFVQEEGSSTAWNVAGAVAQSDLAIKLVPALSMAMEIVQAVRRGRSRS